MRDEFKSLILILHPFLLSKKIEDDLDKCFKFIPHPSSLKTSLKSVRLVESVKPVCVDAEHRAVPEIFQCPAESGVCLHLHLF